MDNAISLRRWCNLPLQDTMYEKYLIIAKKNVGKWEEF